MIRGDCSIEKFPGDLTVVHSISHWTGTWIGRQTKDVGIGKATGSVEL